MSTRPGRDRLGAPTDAPAAGGEPPNAARTLLGRCSCGWVRVGYPTFEDWAEACIVLGRDVAYEFEGMEHEVFAPWVCGGCKQIGCDLGALEWG